MYYSTISIHTYCLQLTLMIPREDCLSITYICAMIVHGEHAGWTSLNDSSNVLCISVTPLINCEGIMLSLYIILVKLADVSIHLYNYRSISFIHYMDAFRYRTTWSCTCIPAICRPSR